MNKKVLVKRIERKTGIKASEIAKVIDSMIESIAEGVKSGEEVSLMGLGTFYISERQERNGYDAVRGVKAVFPAKKRVRFRESKNLKLE